jgi:hypothetical protein
VVDRRILSLITDTDALVETYKYKEFRLLSSGISRSVAW